MSHLRMRLILLLRVLLWSFSLLGVFLWKKGTLPASARFLLRFLLGLLLVLFLELEVAVTSTVPATVAVAAAAFLLMSKSKSKSKGRL